MIEIDRIYTIAELEKCKNVGDVTSNGVAFDWYLAGPGGASFTLISEGQPIDVLRAAEGELWRGRDIVGEVKLARVE